MKRFILILLSIVLVFSLAACNGTKTPEENGGPDTVIGGTFVQNENYAHSGTVEGGNYPRGDEPVSWFDAAVLSVSGNTIFVEAHDESWVKHACAAELYVTTKLYSGETLSSFKQGDKVRIVYDGMIAESYPAQIFTVYNIIALTDDGEVDTGKSYGGTYVVDEGYTHSGTVEGGNYPEGYEPVSWFDAKVVEVYSGKILVESYEDSMYSGLYEVATTLYSGEKLTCFSAGDDIRITYNGMIAMSYPAQIFTVYSIAFLTVEDTSSDFYFSVTWGVFGISSYDSKTGKLVKTTDATHPEDYVTEYFLTDAEREEIRAILTDLDIENLGEFDYDDFGLSDPHLSLSLTVKMGDIDKTVNIPEAEIGYDGGRTPKAKKLLSAIEAIRDILVNTDEWKALPDYEFYYD